MIAVAAVLGMIPGPVKKGLMYAALAGAALWAFKVFWLNPHDNKIEAESRIKVTEEVRKDAEARWKLKYKKLEDQAKSLEEKAVELQLANDSLVRSRESIVSSLNKTLTNIKIIGATNHAQDQAVPDYMLDARLRDESNDLECSRPSNIDKIGCPSATNGPRKKTNP
jgi:hypothetical protein